MQAHCFRDTLTCFFSLQTKAFGTPETLGICHATSFSLQSSTMCRHPQNMFYSVYRQKKALTSVLTNENTHKALSTPLSFLMCWQRSEESHAVPHLLRQALFLFLYLAWVLCTCTHHPRQLWNTPISPSTDTAIIPAQENTHGTCMKQCPP